MNQGELFTSFLIDLQRIFRTKIVPKELSYSQIIAILVIPDDGCLLYTSPSPRDH